MKLLCQDCRNTESFTALVECWVKLDGDGFWEQSPENNSAFGGGEYDFRCRECDSENVVDEDDPECQYVVYGTITRENFERQIKKFTEDK